MGLFNAYKPIERNQIITPFTGIEFTPFQERKCPGAHFNAIMCSMCYIISDSWFIRAFAKSKDTEWNCSQLLILLAYIRTQQIVIMILGEESNKVW